MITFGIRFANHELWNLNNYVIVNYFRKEYVNGAGITKSEDNGHPVWRRM